MTSVASSAPRVVTYELPFWGRAAIDLRDALCAFTGSTAVLVERASPVGDALSATVPLVFRGALPSLDLRVCAAPRVLQSIAAHLGGHLAADVEALEKVLFQLATRVAVVVEKAASEHGLPYAVGEPTVASPRRHAQAIPVTMTYAFGPTGEGVVVEAHSLP